MTPEPSPRIHRDRVGTWYVDGDRVTHTRMARAFDAWLTFTGTALCLRNEVNEWPVTVEGAFDFVLAMDASGILRLRSGRTMPFDPARVQIDPDGLVYASCARGLCYQFTTPAAMQLEPHFVARDDGYVLSWAGAMYPVAEGPIDDASTALTGSTGTTRPTGPT